MTQRWAWLITLFLALFICGCAETQFVVSSAKRIAGTTEMPKKKDPTPGHYKIGDPYKIKDVWYYPKVDFGYMETGIASWYGPQFHGKLTANGEIFDMNEISAAHRTLPLPSVVRVTNMDNGRSIKVRVNDRGPFARGRIIDMSRRGAQLLGFQRAGTAAVRVEILERESREIAAAYGQFVKANRSDKPPPIAAPRVVVTSQSLKPPPGTNAAPLPSNNHKVLAVETAPERDIRQPAKLPLLDETVKLVKVSEKLQIFVQVGAFTQYDNANKMRARLSLIGSAKIYQVRTMERPFFRVRLGPLTDVTKADSILETVIDSGIKDARIVVE